MSAVQSISLQPEQKGADPLGSPKTAASTTGQGTAEGGRQVMEGRKGCSASGKGKRLEHQELISDVKAEKGGVWEC